MAKDQKETTTDTSTPPPKPEAAQAAPAPVASPTEASVPAPPAPKHRGPTCKDIVEAIKEFGAGFSQTERNEIIYAVSTLPAVAQSPAAPDPYDGRDFKFHVSWSDKSSEVMAKNPREAWALFCDSIKTYPSPKSGKVECLGAVV